MKNNLEYYRHDANSHNHWKFKTLRRRYGWAGEGKFWAFNNMIADAEWCALDLSDEDKKVAIATDLDFDIKGFDEFVQFLIHVCKLLVEIDGKLTTDLVQEIFVGVDEKREYQRNWKRKKSNSTAAVSNSKTEKSIIEKEQSIVKETIPKEIKENPNGVAAPAPPKKVGRNKEEEEPEPYWELLVKTWFDFNCEKFGDKPSFARDDPKIFKRIIHRLKLRAAGKKVEWNEITGPQRLRIFLELAFAHSDWLAKNFTLSNLEKHFDPVIMKQKDVKQGHAGGKIPPEPPKTFNEQITYLVGRCKEGQLDERLITADHYDKLVSYSAMPVGSMEHQPGNSIDEKKRKAVIHFLKQKANAPGKEV